MVKYSESNNERQICTYVCGMIAVSSKGGRGLGYAPPIKIFILMSQKVINEAVLCHSSCL